MDENLYFFGENIKLVGNTVQGYLVRFGNPIDTDLEGDYFTSNTDFGRPLNDGQKFALNLYYHHGQDSVVGTKTIGSGMVSMDEKGLWMSAQIDMNDDYNKMIMELAKSGKLGYSSGAAQHLVERKAVGKSYEIKRWNIAEASLTPRPAESRNIVSAKTLKDYYDKQEDDMEEPLDPENIFSGIQEEMLFDSLDCLNERLNEAIKLYIMDSSSVDLEMLYKDYVKYSLSTISHMMLAGIDVEKEVKNLLSKQAHRPVNVRDAEKTLREAMCLSRSEAKKLANVFFTTLCDAKSYEEEINEEVVETKSSEIEPEDNFIKQMLLKKAMLDLIED
jgi:phage head maturation protease